MKNDELYKVLETTFVKPFNQTKRTTFSGFTYSNKSDGRTVFPRLGHFEESGGWCFYDKRGGKKHIRLDEFIFRYINKDIEGVGGFFENGQTSSITFAQSKLLNPTEEFLKLIEIYRSNTGTHAKAHALDVIGDDSSSHDPELSSPDTANVDPVNNIPPSKVQREILARRGAPEFRATLIRAYNKICAVTGCSTLPALEAAHIDPYAVSFNNSATNGILLRADIHTLFDLYLISINPKNWTIEAHSHVIAGYPGLNIGRQITLPTNEKHQPCRLALQRHYDQFKFTQKRRDF